VVTHNEAVGDAGVKEGAGDNAVPPEEGEAIATATVDDLRERGVLEPGPQDGVGAQQEGRDSADVEDVSVPRGIGGEQRTAGKRGSVNANL